jgi:hypothetical protein
MDGARGLLWLAEKKRLADCCSFPGWAEAKNVSIGGWEGRLGPKSIDCGARCEFAVILRGLRRGVAKLLD